MWLFFVSPIQQSYFLNLPLCFSFASMKMVKTNSAVRIASMNTPRAKLVSADNVVLTLSGVGNKMLTR